MLILKGKVSNIKDKNFTLTTAVKSRVLELDSYFYHIDNVTNDGIYVVVGDMYFENKDFMNPKLKVNTVFSSVADDKTDYAVATITGQIKYFGKNTTSFIGKNSYAKYQVETKVGKNYVYYTCSTKMSDAQVPLFEKLQPDQIITATGNLDMEEYNGKLTPTILTNSFNILEKKNSDNTATDKGKDTDFDFGANKTKTPLDNDF
jgi:hypothetical protein